MSKTWHGFVQYNGEDVSIFRRVEFEVTEEQNAAIQEAIRSETPLCDLDIYEDLLASAEDAFDLSEYLGVEDDRPEEPDPDEYEDEEEYTSAVEEYEEALSEYDQRIEEAADEYYLEDVSIEDPTLLKQLIKDFCGKRISPENLEWCDHSLDDKYRYEIDFEEESSRLVRYSGTLIFNKDGQLEDIVDLYAEGLESESIRSSSYDECAPDYDFLEDEIQNTFSWEEWN